VSTNDIAATIKALLASHDEASRIALTADDITFDGSVSAATTATTTTTTTIGDRVKTLGTFDITIALKQRSMKTKISVRPLGSS
jgi:hypothetical protein